MEQLTPDEIKALKAGDTVTIARFFIRLDDSAHISKRTVSRRTAKRVYIENSRRFIDLETGRVSPKYLDYTEFVVRSSETGGDQ